MLGIAEPRLGKEVAEAESSRQLCCYVRWQKEGTYLGFHKVEPETKSMTVEALLRDEDKVENSPGP